MPFRFIRFFADLSLADLPLVGGKNASLGEMIQALAPKGVKIPDGFAITAEAYRYVLDCAGAWDRLRQVLAGLNPNDVQDLKARAAKARRIVYEAGIPDELREEI
ncbi:MAG: PEP/pyruvate-binding domain-containing protein, partial [Methylohalobius sp.]